jgi:hypothetical protein
LPSPIYLSSTSANGIILNMIKKVLYISNLPLPPVEA